MLKPIRFAGILFAISSTLAWGQTPDKAKVDEGAEQQDPDVAAAEEFVREMRAEAERRAAERAREPASEESSAPSNPGQRTAEATSIAEFLQLIKAGLPDQSGPAGKDQGKQGTGASKDVDRSDRSRAVEDGR